MTLEIGKRYWLDSIKDVSGVYLGHIPSPEEPNVLTYQFNQVKGDRNPYLFYDNTAIVGFTYNRYFYPVDL